ncbi:MAG: element excision factor XisH family protein [Bacteroidota bacterium]
MARDKYHSTVVEALEKEGWIITDDPLYLDIVTTTLEVDLGAERLIAATKGSEKIAIEIKSFVGVSRIADFYKALGQFNYYFLIMEEEEPERELYLAIPEEAYKDLLKEPTNQKIISRFRLKLIIYDVHKNEIIKWIK